MKLVPICGLLAVMLSATIQARDLKTVSGETFKNVTILKKDATGLQITHDDGVGFVDFRNLGETEQKEFGYEPMAYIAAWQQKIDEEKLRRQKQAVAAQQAQARAQAQADQQTTEAPVLPPTRFSNATGLEVTVDSPGFSYGGYPIYGGYPVYSGGFSNVVPPRYRGNIPPYPYFPYDGRNGAHWGPLEIRRR